MGYRISSLASLPIIHEIELYIFVIYKNHWRNGLSGAIESEFNKLAQRIGSKAAIVIGHDGEDIGSEIWQIIRQKPGMERLARRCSDSYPGILIVGAHPNEITPNDLILFIPLDRIREQYKGNYDVFFNALSEFAQNRNEDFIRRFEDKTDYIGDILDIIEIKPEFLGISFNVKAFINKLRKAKKTLNAT